MTTPTLPADLEPLIRPLFDALPLGRAMPRLVGAAPPAGHVAGLAARIADDAAVADRPALAAGLWLYVDDLDRSHRVSQSIDDATGSFWHGIMHRREGDFSNSRYWLRRAGRHPAMEAVGEGYDPHALIDRVEAAAQSVPPPADLLDLQRREWLALFLWCAGQRSV